MKASRLKAFFLAGALLTLGATVAAQAEDLKVGVMAAKTGPYAFASVPIYNGIELAISEANASNFLGDNKIQIIDADSAGDKGQALTLATRFANSDNVLMILGPTTSVEATAVAPVVNELKVPMLSTSTAKAVNAAGPYASRMQTAGSDSMGPLAEYAATKLGVKRVALIFDRGSEGYIGQKDGFKAAMEKAGATIVSEDGILASDTDFLALATKLASSEIDAFFIVAPAEVGANLLLQIRQAGVPNEVRMLAPSSYASESFTSIAGSAAEGTIVSADYFVDDPSSENQAFVAAYSSAYGQKPDNWAAVGYALGKLALAAVKNAGDEPTRESVMQALTTLRDQPTLLGSGVWNMDQDRNPYYGAVLITVKDGKFTLAP